LDNRITGNAAANTLDGGAGADTLTGGAGNDSYFVDSSRDVVRETGTGATEVDTVSSTVSYALAANVEHLVLTGTAAIHGTGNALANRVSGNAAANVLDGGAGADTLAGGAGGDVYIVDSAGDVVAETGAGAAEVDTVRSSVAFTLGANLENLVLTGTGAVSGTGNGSNNQISGNGAANRIAGGSGNDTLEGGLGADQFVFDTTPAATNQDTILDFTLGSDQILLDQDVFSQLTAFQDLAYGDRAIEEDDYLLYDGSTGNLLYDADASGFGAAVLIARIDAGLFLTASDILVF
jgi:Ca2+-binding RTX toxin-like protein